MKADSFLFKILIVILASLLVSASFSIFSINAAENSDEVNSSFWLTLAKYAWNYFQPGNGVVTATGLAGADIGNPQLTDWDLGFYIQAIIDAEKIGLINKTGNWGADDRINKVLTFLENRPLHPNGTTYVWYSALNYQNMDNLMQVATDTGKLLIALKNLKAFNPELNNRIDNIVYQRTDYESQRQAIDYMNLTLNKDGVYTLNIYDYYLTYGFVAFWPEKFSAKIEAIADVIFSAPTINYNGVVLPKIKISSDPLLFSIFELEKHDDRLIDLTKRVYLAHEARYNATGRYTAFSEGSTGLETVPVVYEWVVMSDGRTWITQYVSQESGSDEDPRNYEVSIAPIIYLKAAVGYLALYNTTYAQNMVNYLIGQLPYPEKGFNQGVDENGRALSHSNMGVSNGAIVTAARYALEHNVTVSSDIPVPTSTPQPNYQNPSTSPSPTATVKPETSPAPFGEKTIPTFPSVPNPAETPIPTPSPTNNGSTTLIVGLSRNQVFNITVSAVAIAVLVASGVIYAKKTKARKIFSTDYESLDKQ